MFYKPKFCCQCGEKIDGAQRKFWTSRRFCELCATEFGLYERIPQIIGGILIAFGLFGTGIYLQKPAKPLMLTQHQTTAPNGKADLPTANMSATKNIAAQVSAARGVQQTDQNGSSENRTVAPNAPLAKSDLKIEPAAAQVAPAKKVYFCGAPTQKGTMCSRRVKNGGRCWQHEGQTAMLPQEKLLAVR